MRPVSPPYLLPIALVAPLAVSALLALVRDDVDASNAALVLVLVVVGVSASGRRAAGAVAALSATVWFDFFLTEPYQRFTIDDRDDLETAVLLVVVGLAVTEIALWGRRQQARASEREGYLHGVVGAASMALDPAARPAAIVDYVARQVVVALGVEECRYVAAPPSPAHPRMLPDGRVVRGDALVDVDRSGLPSDDVVVLPVAGEGAPYGHFELVAASRTVWPSREQRQVAAVLAEHVGHVIAARGHG